MSDYVNSVHPSSLLRLNGLFIEIAAGGNCLKTQQTAKFKDYKEENPALFWQTLFRKSNRDGTLPSRVLFRIENSGDLTLQTVHFQYRASKASE